MAHPAAPLGSCLGSSALPSGKTIQVDLAEFSFGSLHLYLISLVHGKGSYLRTAPNKNF